MATTLAAYVRPPRETVQNMSEQINAIMMGKPKSHSTAHGRLTIVLLAFMGGMFLASLYPAVWFIPPYTLLTPFVYAGISALWIPFAIHHRQQHGLNRWLAGLMIGCLLSTGAMFAIQYGTFFQYSSEIDLRCAERTDTLCDFYSGWVIYRYDFEPIRYTPFMTIKEWRWHVSSVLF
jgi:hypothetical protein